MLRGLFTNMSPDLDVTYLCVDLKGSAAAFVLSATAGKKNPTNVAPSEDLSIAMDALDKIYTSIWSRDCFIQEFVATNKFQLKVVTKNEEATLKFFEDCHTGHLLSNLNSKISEISAEVGIKFEEVLVTGMKNDKLNCQQYEELKTKSQMKMLTLKSISVNKNVSSGCEKDDDDNVDTVSLSPNLQRQVSSTLSPLDPETQSLQLEELEAVTSSTPGLDATMVEDEPSAKKRKLKIDAENVYLDSQVHHHHRDLGQPSVDVDALGEELKDTLRTKAQIHSGYIPTPVPVKRKYDVVKLELERNPTLIGMDYEFERSWLRQNRVVSLFSKNSGNIKIEDIFQESKENAAKESETSCKLPKTRHSYVQQHGNIVGVIGQAGIGKTTFTKMLISHILSNEFSFSVSFLFYVLVRDIDFKTECNVLQFLLGSSVPDWQHSSESDRALLEKICIDKGVMVIIDGFDEAQFTGEKFNKISHFGNASPHLILLNIISGNILPLAKKVITSRPQSLYDLPAQQRPHFIIQVIGLSSESQDKLGHQICGESYKELKSIMYKNPDISLYWYVPIYCIMACSYFANRNEAEPLSFTMTSLLTATFVDYVSTEHLRGKEAELEKIAELAWLGVNSQKCLFTSYDLKAVGLDYNTVQAFLQVALTKGLHLNMSILQGHQLTFFSHLIWQEYFAAIHLLSQPEKSFAKHVGHYIESEVVEKFLFGLCNRKVFSQLKAVLPISVKSWRHKKFMLTKFIQKKVLSIAITKKSNLAHLLPVASLLLEAQDADMLAAVVEYINHERFLRLSGSLLPSDVVSLCYLLRGLQDLHRGIEKIIVDPDLNVPDLDDTTAESSLDRLLREIATGIKIKDLVLTGTKLCNAKITLLSKCIPFIGHLYIERCNITHFSLPPIVEKLQGSLLSDLRLSGNKVCDAGIQLLAPSITNLQYLYLGDCGITSIGVKILSASLLDLAQPLVYLDLSGNKIGDEGAEFLSVCLKKIKQLCLLLCQITAKGTVKLGHELKEIEEPMDLLDLSENAIGDEGVNILCQCQGKLQKLLLQFCDLTREQRQKFVELDINVEFSNTAQVHTPVQQQKEEDTQLSTADLFILHQYIYDHH